MSGIIKALSPTRVHVALFPAREPVLTKPAQITRG